MRRILVTLAIAAALVIPVAATAADPPEQGSPQESALLQPNVPYLPAAGSPCGIEFTPNQARAWWITWFANPVDLAAVRPALLPGSLVLTPDQYAAAVALQRAGNTLPDAPRTYNPLDLPVNDLIGGVCPHDPIVVPQVSLNAVAPAVIAKLRTYIARLTACACDAAKLALYEARLDDYLAR
jgi:hypothetical protein